MDGWIKSPKDGSGVLAAETSSSSAATATGGGNAAWSSTSSYHDNVRDLYDGTTCGLVIERARTLLLCLFSSSAHSPNVTLRQSARATSKGQFYCQHPPNTAPTWVPTKPPVLQSPFMTSSPSIQGAGQPRQLPPAGA